AAHLALHDALPILNLYGEAASQLTPNRLGGEPARFLGLHEARLRPVTAIVAIGVEVACEWPVFVLAAGALIAYYVPDWRDAARIWLRHHRAGELVTLEITVLLILVTVYLLQRLARGLPDGPPFGQMFFGALALLHAPLIVPLPSGGGGLEVAFLNGFAGYFGARQVTMLLWWRFYTAILLTVFGVYALVRSVGYHAAVQLFKIGWGRGKRREEPT